MVGARHGWRHYLGDKKNRLGLGLGIRLEIIYIYGYDNGHE